MIPPCDPTVLKSNPQFEKLYQQLTTNLLNADGSTRANDAQPARQAVLEVRLPPTSHIRPGLSVSLCVWHSGSNLILNTTGFEELSITTCEATDCETDVETISIR